MSCLLTVQEWIRSLDSSYRTRGINGADVSSGMGNNKIQILECKGDWVKIRRNGIEEWVRSDLLTGDLIASMSLVDFAMSLCGKQRGTIRQNWKSSSTFDLDGAAKFVSYVYKKSMSRELPTTITGLCKLGIFVDKSKLETGDLVFFGNREHGFSHVGICTGKDKFVSAINSGDVVIHPLEEYISSFERVEGRRLK